MPSRHERRAAALEAIAHALLELAAVEREPQESASPAETLLDRRNCERELGLNPHAFVAAAGRDFPAFRVSRRLTATKADVLAWMKTRTVQPKPPRPIEAAKPTDPDALLKLVHAQFVKRAGRPMTDQELEDAEMCIDVGHDYAKMTGREFNETPDEIAARVESRIGREPVYYRDWRSCGLDPAKLEKEAEDLRKKLHLEHPEWTWRDRQRAVNDMLNAITEPLYEARRKARAEARAAKKAEKVRHGHLGLKK